MLVEIYEKDGAWWLKDEEGLECSVILGNAKPQEAKCYSDNLKTVKKLKKEGFAIDEIVELFNEGIV
jgi:hypothetical protein